MFICFCTLRSAFRTFQTVVSACLVTVFMQKEIPLHTSTEAIHGSRERSREQCEAQQDDPADPSHYFIANGQSHGRLPFGPSWIQTQAMLGNDTGGPWPRAAASCSRAHSPERRLRETFLSANFWLLSFKEMGDLVSGQSPSADTSCSGLQGN